MIEQNKMESLIHSITVCVKSFTQSRFTLSRIQDLGPDVMVVVAFPPLLPQTLLRSAVRPAGLTDPTLDWEKLELV